MMNGFLLKEQILNKSNSYVSNKGHPVMSYSMAKKENKVVP